MGIVVVSLAAAGPYCGKTAGDTVSVGCPRASWGLQLSDAPKNFPIGPTAADFWALEVGQNYGWPGREAHHHEDREEFGRGG